MSERMDMDKTQKEFMEAVRKMMAQPAVQKDPEAAKAEKESEETRQEKRQKILEFNYRPKDIKKYLDRFVIRQDDAKKVLATAVCDHYNYVRACEQGHENRNYIKPNILMLGPTGVGKTYLIKCLADLIGVPFVKADATKFSETGYVGADVDDLVRDLVYRAEGDLELAKYGMVYIDEVDKIASASNLSGRDVSGGGVQRGLLKIMEETDVALRAANDIQSQIQSMMEFQQKGKITRPTVNTRHILFIVSGAFGGLPQLISKRLRATQIGFSAQDQELISTSNLFRHVTTDDFIQFGFEPEFIGRLPVRVVCDPLTEDDLYHILSDSEGSLLKQYQTSFQSYDITMDVQAAALREIARQAASENTGARGLLTIFERLFREYKFELPSSHVKHFSLSGEDVRHPREALEKLMAHDLDEQRSNVVEAIEAFERAFQAKNGIAIQFDQEAREQIETRVAEGNRDVQEYLNRILSNYPYGLGLIQKVQPREQFVLSRDAVEDPNGALDRWVKESYERS